MNVIESSQRKNCFSNYCFEIQKCKTEGWKYVEQCTAARVENKRIRSVKRKFFVRLREDRKADSQTSQPTKETKTPKQIELTEILFWRTRPSTIQDCDDEAFRKQPSKPRFATFELVTKFENTFLRVSPDLFSFEANLKHETFAKTASYSPRTTQSSMWSSLQSVCRCQFRFTSKPIRNSTSEISTQIFILHTRFDNPVNRRYVAHEDFTLSLQFHHRFCHHLFQFRSVRFVLQRQVLTEIVVISIYYSCSYRTLLTVSIILILSDPGKADQNVLVFQSGAFLGKFLLQPNSLTSFPVCPTLWLSVFCFDHFKLSDHLLFQTTWFDVVG